VVDHVVRTRLCDIPNCTDEAERLRLTIGDERWRLDLCKDHQTFVMSLPWAAEPAEPATRYEAARRRMNAQLEERIRLPNGSPTRGE
jgi:hypothetical protein